VYSSAVTHTASSATWAKCASAATAALCSECLQCCGNPALREPPAGPPSPGGSSQTLADTPGIPLWRGRVVGFQTPADTPAVPRWRVREVGASRLPRCAGCLAPSPTSRTLCSLCTVRPGARRQQNLASTVSGDVHVGGEGRLKVHLLCPFC